jgi:hypothetical protein
MIKNNLKLEGKHVLLSIQETLLNWESLVLELLEEKVLLTLALTRETPLSKTISTAHKAGELGILHKQMTGDDARNYHWVIQLSSKQGLELVQGCRLHRTLFSLVNHEALSDINIHLSETKQEEEEEEEEEDLNSLHTLARTDSANSLLQSLQEPVGPREGETGKDIRRRPKLYLVGVGPGSPELLTVKASRLLQTIPVIISDRLVCNDIFSSVPSTTRILFSRKICGKANVAQAEINQWIQESLEAGSY